jgi:hypothetical protein
MELVTQTQTTTVDVETTVYQDRPTTFNDTMQSLATDTEVDRFVDSLILPDDFVLDSERTKVIFIKGVAMKQISVKVLRKICVRYKVSGYKKAKKAFTVALIARLLKRERGYPLDLSMSMNQTLNWIVIMIITKIHQLMMRNSKSMKIAKMIMMKGTTKLKRQQQCSHMSLWSILSLNKRK